MDKGCDYVRWVKNVKRYGYNYDYRLLNSADFGAGTTRKRFFGMFAKKGLPIVFPTPTHSRHPTGNLKKWQAVRQVLDLEDVGQSIFTRKKPLAENTLVRIYAGLIRFVADGKGTFMVKFNSMNQRGKYVPPSIDEPCPTVAAQNRLGVAHVAFLSKQFSGEPNGKNISLDEPAGAITCVDHHALVTAQFLTMHYGTSKASSIYEPCGCVTTKPKHSLVTVKKSFLVKPHKGTIDNPCTVTTESGELAVVIYETDSPTMIKIKEFMVMYGIADIYMRMLKVVELKRIQGFPDSYVLLGNQSDQKKFIGNAVHTSIPKAWCPVLCQAIQNLKSKSVAVW